MRKITVLFSTILFFSAVSMLHAQDVFEKNRSTNLDIVGNLHPVGGSLTYIGTETYSLEGIDNQEEIESIVWAQDPQIWPMQFNADMTECQLQILSCESDTIFLTVKVILKNGEEIVKSLPITCSYFDVEENYEDLAVEIAPNPTNGDVKLRLNKMRGNVNVAVFDMRGARIDAFEVNNVNTSEEVPYSFRGSPSGVYVFMVRSDNKVMTQKVLVH